MERAPAAGDAVPPVHAPILRALEVGEIVTTTALHARIGERLGKSSTKDARMARLRKAMAFAAKAGIVSDATRPRSSPHGDFLRIPCVAEWIGMLNAPNTLHSKGRRGGTRSIYGYALYRFHEWVAGRTVAVTARVDCGNGTFREERRDVEVRGADHVLELALEGGEIGRDLSVLIRQFFADLNSQRRYSSSVMMQTQSALKSFFTCHEIPYGLQIPRHMLRGTGSGNGGGGGGGAEEWECRDLRMSEFHGMLTTGRPTVRDRAVLLSKFHRGLDLSTLADRFNYTAFDQIAAHMGSDDPASWDLDKCPVPVTLTRVKTDYRHVGFLERDAVSAIADWIAERERLTGRALKRGDGQALYINQFGAPITAQWIGERFRRLAVRIGLCRQREGGGLSSTRHPHQLRHPLKSTLIDAGCRIDVADHVIGHSPKDAYERQSALYPDSLRQEYAKAAGRINIFANFEKAINGSGDICRLRAEAEAVRKRLREARAEAEAREKSGVGGGGGIGGPVAEMIVALREDVRRLQEDRGRGAGRGGKGGGGGAGLEYQCIPCSLVHSSTACPSCGSAERRVYGGGGGR